MRTLAALLASVLLSAVTISPEGPIVATSPCGAEPHDPAGRHLDDRDCADEDCAGEGCDDGCACDDGCGETGCSGCSHTHVRALAASAAIVPAALPIVIDGVLAVRLEAGERDGFHTLPLRPPSA